MYQTTMDFPWLSNYQIHQKVCILDNKALWTKKPDSFNIFVFSKSPLNKDSKEIKTKYPAGIKLPFYVTMNGVKRIRGKYQRPASIEEILERFEQKSIDVFSLEALEMRSLRKYVSEEKGIAFFPAYLSGVLSVTDPDKFQNILESGFSRGHFVGFGILDVWN
jgi:hypothetical protein